MKKMNRKGVMCSSIGWISRSNSISRCRNGSRKRGRIQGSLYYT